MKCPNCYQKLTETDPYGGECFPVDDHIYRECKNCGYAETEELEYGHKDIHESGDLMKRVRTGYCKKCVKRVILKTVSFTERTYDEEDPYQEGYYHTCTHCETPIHHYPCWDWITEQSCAECRGIADEY